MSGQRVKSLKESTAPTNHASLSSLLNPRHKPGKLKHLSLPQEGKNKIAFVVQNFLSGEECRRLIAASENSKEGYEVAMVNLGYEQREMLDVRNNYRWIHDDPLVCDILFKRMRNSLPKELKKFQQRWKVEGLNERLRFLRYDEGQYFAPHFDGCFIRRHGKREGDTSFLTVMLYLNEDYEGGATTFLSSSPAENCLAVQPSEGMLLVFEHRVYHEGSCLEKGRKYAIRSDVMYTCKCSDRSANKQTA